MEGAQLNAPVKWVWSPKAGLQRWQGSVPGAVLSLPWRRSVAGHTLGDTLPAVTRHTGLHRGHQPGVPVICP